MIKQLAWSEQDDTRRKSFSCGKNKDVKTFESSKGKLTKQMIKHVTLETTRRRNVKTAWYVGYTCATVNWMRK